jgi:hypothetical protein
MAGEIPGYINCPCGNGEDFRFRYGEECEKVLEPCELIQDKHLCLGIIGNSNLNLDKLRITERDRQAIVFHDGQTGKKKELIYPGKSVFIVVDPDLCDKKFVRGTVETLLNNYPGRQDHIYVARVVQIEAVGWVAYHAPQQEKGIINHVRLVAKNTIERQIDPTDEDIKNLQNAFKIVPHLHG